MDNSRQAGITAGASWKRLTAGAEEGGGNRSNAKFISLAQGLGIFTVLAQHGQGAAEKQGESAPNAEKMRFLLPGKRGKMAASLKFERRPNVASQERLASPPAHCKIRAGNQLTPD
jgi:hypothetical protein